MRSGFERSVAKHLKSRNIDFGYESITYEITVPVRSKNQYCVDCNGSTIMRDTIYTPDFFLPNGIVVEAKGRFMAKDRLIAKAMKEQHPEVDIRMLFMGDNKISPSSKTRYRDWCERNDIKCAVSKTGKLPEEWYDEKE